MKNVVIRKIILKRNYLVLLIFFGIAPFLFLPSVASAEWDISIIDSGDDHNSIAIDSNNMVHISYPTPWPDYALNYATNVSGSWITYEIDSSVRVELSSIAVDSNNKVHISYATYAAGFDDLFYATNTSGSWATYPITSGSRVIDNSIAIDSNNKVHISVPFGDG